MNTQRRDSGWVALPDAPEMRAVADRFDPHGRIVLPHASGNPWLVGHFAPDELVPVALGPVRVALVGRCPIDAARLAELARAVHSVSDVDGIVRALPGGVHVVVSVGGDVRVQGGISGLRQVFHGVREGFPIAGDRADLLAGLLGAGIDDRALAAQVSCAQLPPPLAGQSIWSGIRAVPADSYLRLLGHRATEVRWWHPPEPEVPLRRGARFLLERLESAMETGAGEAGRAGSELSGGMESAALCSLAAARNSDLLALRIGNGGRESAAPEWRSAEPLVLDDAELPDMFAEPDAAADPEHPYPGWRTAARIRYSARILGERGVRRHFAAHGGEELFHDGPAHLHALLRHRPVTALRRLRGYRAARNWALPPTISALLSAHDVGRWWHEQADRLTEPYPDSNAPRLDWGAAPVRVAPWASAEAVSTTRALLHRTARKTERLAPDRATHQLLSALRTGAPAHRRLARSYAAAGVRLELPFHDDRVVEAVLAVRPHERCSPWEDKPLLAEAMREVLPGALPRRANTGDGEAIRIGFRRNRAAILALFADSELAQHDLIDTGVLRRHLLAPHVGEHTLFQLDHLLGCENWLRSATRESTGRTDVPATAS
ncbi:asparagine synthase-related protein [Saccharopolyspora sp. SCSIO 74807]|uniref:asparagine synthase-related protein n=1 Tax=Saccharopolyspora sp. SCSIO 74807 TaxID=3118084 RepID=UPI0030D1A9FB